MNSGKYKVYSKYAAPNKATIQKFIEYLYQQECVIHIYVAGAITFDRVDKYSDLDVHCVVKNKHISIFRSIINNYIKANDSAVVYAIKKRQFPWFGELTTIYFHGPMFFYIDIGCI
jgi:hypothetical protein